jgi:FkbM family methyltransferase
MRCGTTLPHGGTGFVPIQWPCPNKNMQTLFPSSSSRDGFVSWNKAGSASVPLLGRHSPISANTEATTLLISYAQNQEDVVLHRLLKLVPIGSYVDVGAGHPVFDNVTYDLYLAGWRGVNIEPMEREAELLRSERPEDETVQLAVGAQPGTLNFFEAPQSNRGATTAREDLVERYRAEGEAFSPFEAEVRTLSSVIDEHVNGQLHVLKIDVEGMEAEVLAGAELHRIRPWVLVIEATIPNTRVQSVDAWEGIVLDAGYRVTLFDGLNRFYVRDDLKDIADLLSAPANVFDRWVRHTEETLHASLAEAEAYVQSLKDELRSLDEYATSLIDELDRTRARASVAEEYAQNLERELRGP